jgi:hypothetical protein
MVVTAAKMKQRTLWMPPSQIALHLSLISMIDRSLSAESRGDSGGCRGDLGEGGGGDDEGNLAMCTHSTAGGASFGPPASRTKGPESDSMRGCSAARHNYLPRFRSFPLIA